MTPPHQPPHPCAAPMSKPTLRFTFLGLSITSSWGNGHATTYRALTRSLADAGHEVLFLERDVPWYVISWDEFFEKFDENNLAFLYQEELASGETSRFFKFVKRETAGAAH